MHKGRGEVARLSDLFEKYRKVLQAPQKTVIESFCEVVEDLIGLRVDPKSVSYTVGSKTLTARVSGPLKSEIKMRKAEILAHLKGRLGEKSAPTEIL